ncbi:MAG: sugar-binding transcriptional regulator [Firmicutes bacterium]|nr:sugar-binding transcriptional regulator [Bacillota bacterium]
MQSINEERRELELVVRAARLYYEDRLTQMQVAKQLHLSRPKVSRLLKRARDDGFIQIRISDPFEDQSELERALKDRFGLLEALVIPSGADSPDEISRDIGRASTEFVMKFIRDKDTIGVGWGTTIYNFLQSLQNVSPPERNATFVPLIGGLGEAEDYFQVNDFARRLHAKLGGIWHSLHAPALVGSSEIKGALLSDANIKAATSLWERLNVALVGIGAFGYQENVHPPMLHTRYFSREDIEAIKDERAVGDICSRFFDINGRPCKLNINDRIIGIELEQLRRADVSIAMAGGLHKVNAILGALRGGFVNMLITDKATALRLLQFAAARDDYPAE